MKFTDGYWNLRSEVEKMANLTQVRDTYAEENALTVFAACKKVGQRGDTLNEPLITCRYSSPMKDVIRVQIVHHAGKVTDGPTFEVTDYAPVVQIEDKAENAVLTSGDLSVSIEKASWNVAFRYKGRRITGCGPRTTGYVVEKSGDAFIREQLDLNVGECVYGLGERFTPFVKNGQSVDIWNEDGGTASEQAYKNIPFYITNGGYGVFVNDTGRVSYEVASEVVSRVQFSVPGESLDYYVVGGDSMKDVLRSYTALTGRPALPPAWSFGLWLTTSFTTSYDEETVNGFIDGMAQRDLPLSVFHFDCFWMKEYQWCDFEWDRDVFPNPPAMLKRLKDKGLKICVWINPYIAQKSRLFREGMDNGYLLKTKDGGVWQWDMWQAGMGLVDFSNPAAVEWYKGKLKALVHMGVDCFKTDFGERIPTDAVYFDGSDPYKMHNYYTYLYNKAVFEALDETMGHNNVTLFARSATVGGQKFPVHWGGDCSANYASMAETLRGGLSLGLSGFGFWSHDISGFEKTAPADIYKRWVAFGLLSSHSRLHGNESYRVPWLFDEEAVDVVRFFTKLKCSLMPYLFAKACEAVSDGLPMLRAMVLEFCDPACATLDLQYMLGESLLVAPIFNEEGTARYYVPQGEWISLIDGKTVAGGHFYEEKFDYFSLPLLVRPNSVIATGSRDDRPDYDYANGVTFKVFGLCDGAAASADVFGQNGEKETSVTVSRSGGVYTVEASGAEKPWKLCLRGIAGVSSVTGGTASAAKEGVVIVPDRGALTLTVKA